jgi:type II secretory pathway component PulF
MSWDAHNTERKVVNVVGFWFPIAVIVIGLIVGFASL